MNEIGLSMFPVEIRKKLITYIADTPSYSEQLAAYKSRAFSSSFNSL